MTFDKRVSTPQVFRVDCPEMIADGRFEDASVDQRGDPVQQLMLFNHRRRTEHRPRKQECQVQRDRFALERHDIPRRRVMIKTTRHRTSARILRSPDSFQWEDFHQRPNALQAGEGTRRLVVCLNLSGTVHAPFGASTKAAICLAALRGNCRCGPCPERGNVTS